MPQSAAPLRGSNRSSFGSATMPPLPAPTSVRQTCSTLTAETLLTLVYRDLFATRPTFRYRCACRGGPIFPDRRMPGTLVAMAVTAEQVAGNPGDSSGASPRDLSHEVSGTRSFLPAVEGLRACAALGVIVTHVAFQTGHTSGAVGRLLGRFDLAVAVFFALSGFLLWRGHAAAVRGLRPTPATGRYLRSRVVRIMPGY